MCAAPSLRRESVGSSRAVTRGVVGSRPLDDPDAIWKPGYDGPPPVRRAASTRGATPPAGGARRSGADRGDITAGRGGSGGTRRRRRWPIGVAAALSLVIGATLVLDVPGIRDRSGDDEAETSEPPGTDDTSGGAAEPSASPGATLPSPDSMVFGGPAARRLPERAEIMWSVELPTDGDHHGDHWVDVVRDDVVLVAAATPPPPPSSSASSSAVATQLVALDASSGERVWDTQLAATPGEVSLVGAVADVVVAAHPSRNGSTLVALDLDTGQVRWRVRGDGDGAVGLVGTRFVAWVPAAGPVSLVDAASGRQAGTIGGGTTQGGPATWSTDRRGRWFVPEGRRVVAYDLRDDVERAADVGRVRDATAPRAVVDGRLVTVDRSGEVQVDGTGDGTRDGLRRVPGVPAPARSLSPVAGRSLVTSAPGSITGLELVGESATVTWSREQGVIVDEYPVEQGTILRVATRGGAGMELVDGRSGRTVEHLTIAPSALQSLVVAGDGVAVLRGSPSGSLIAGLGLDGSLRWSIPGAGPVAVGDGVVARAVPVGEDSETLRVTAYGDLV